ncbi:MAG: type II secretion system F family protein [Verrucomicrobiales bacterium]|nr:type II secretion system F family protein [Verrucomicrobiales bacterium]
MKSDEFAFFNQQLAGMLRDGLPLEGSLRQLVAGMRSGPLRNEITALEKDLAAGEPLPAAMERRRLPEFYRHMVRAGAAGQNLPEILTLLADHYQRRHALWTRLTGLLTYPFILLIMALCLSGLMLWLQRTIFVEIWGSVVDEWGWMGISSTSTIQLWILPAVCVLGLGVLSVALLLPFSRRRLGWQAPGFREASLARFADSMRLLLTGGSTLDDALALMADMEKASPAGRELALWRRRLGEGKGRFTEFSEGGRVFPPLFRWLVAQGGEDLKAGFRRAAEIFDRRARYRVEMMLYAALPVSILAVGMLIAVEVVCAFRPLIQFMNALANPM